MFRGLVAASVALAVLVPAAASTAQAPSTRDAAASRATAAPREVVARTVKVGHDPLRIKADGPKKTVRLTFRGKEGQLLNLALWAKGGGESFPRPPCASWELRRGSKVIKDWAPGYWKIPRTATYVASVEPCKRLGGRARLRKVVVTDAVLDGSITQVGERRDVTHLVLVGVPAGEVVTTLEDDEIKYVILPDGTTIIPRPFYGISPGSGHGRRCATDTQHARAPLPRPRPRGAAQHRSGAEAGSPGRRPRVTLANQGARARRHLITFTGKAGQWIYAELTEADGKTVPLGRKRVGLSGPDLGFIHNRILATCPGEETTTDCDYIGYGAWQLPADGTYQMSAYVAVSTGSAAFGLRVRAAVVADALTVDGPAVTYAATSPGQWVIGTIPESATYTTIATASNASASLTDWRVTAVTGFPNTCGSKGGNGCADYYYADLTPADLTQPLSHDYNAGPRLALLSVPPNVQGSLDLRLTSS